MIILIFFNPQEAFNIARMVFSDSPSENESLKGISWMGLRYILTEIIYGSYINDDYDRTNLSAMVDYWIGPNATKREFEATKCTSFYLILLHNFKFPFA